jgi:two-component system sensor kinase FixL
LSVSLRRAGDTAVLEVEDSGGGVAADVKNNIFEPLVTTKKDGLGLGLSMSRSVVEAHGGAIMLEDSVLGGAKFVVILPRENA